LAEGVCGIHGSSPLGGGADADYDRQSRLGASPAGGVPRGRPGGRRAGALARRGGLTYRVSPGL